MLLSSKTAVFKRLGMGLAGLAAMTVLSACQVKPLYSEGSGASTSRTSIAFTEANTRVEQEVRNALIFRIAGGAGEPADPQYEVALEVTSQVVGALYNQVSDRPSAGRVVVTGDYNLTSTDTGRTISSGRRSAVALVDFPTQEFAQLRAIKDGENRASRELAEIIGAEIAAALAR